MKSRETSHVRHFNSSKIKPNESLVAFLDGWIGDMMGKGKDAQHSGALLLTNERISFCRKGFLGEIFQTIPIEKITSIETKSFMGYKALTFHTSHDDLTFKTFESAELVTELHEQVEKLRTGSKTATPPSAASPLDTLLKLAELKEIGAITEEEYAAKKAELLRKV